MAAALCSCSTETIGSESLCVNVGIVLNEEVEEEFTLWFDSYCCWYCFAGTKEDVSLMFVLILLLLLLFSKRAPKVDLPRDDDVTTWGMLAIFSGDVDCEKLFELLYCAFCISCDCEDSGPALAVCWCDCTNEAVWNMLLVLIGLPVWVLVFWFAKVKERDAVEGVAFFLGWPNVVPKNLA